jgi:hypothetical protein
MLFGAANSASQLEHDSTQSGGQSRTRDLHKGLLQRWFNGPTVLCDAARLINPAEWDTYSRIAVSDAP